MEDFGPITSYLSSPHVSEIMVNGPDKIFIEQDGKLVQIDKRFADENELLRVVRQLLTLSGRSMSPQEPLMDTRLADGSRMTVTLPPVSPTASFTIRRPGHHMLDMNELVRQKTMSQSMAAFLQLAVFFRANILIAGGTSSGKTTLLNSLAAGIPKTQRVVTIEDTFEISLDHPNWVALETVFEGRGDRMIDMRALVSHALHLRPDRILVGEVRGGEALDMLQAMNSGHDGSLVTIHANSPYDAVSRLETMVLTAGYEIPVSAIRDQVIRAVHLIVHMNRTPDGKRQISAISEVAAIENDHMILNDVFLLTHDPVSNKAIFFPTQHVPRFIQGAIDKGIQIPTDPFTAPAFAE